MSDVKKKLKHKLSIKTYQQPMLFVIMTMVFINIVILVIAAIIAIIIDPSYTNFIQAFVFGSVTWMLTPNAILTIDHPPTLGLAVIVFIIGLVLFSGTIIALTTNAIKDYFERKKQSEGKIDLNNHILILNYNNKVPELIADLLHVKSKTVTILILAAVEKKDVETKILDALKKTKPLKNIKHLSILVKNGDPLSEKDLKDVSVLEASTLMVMNDKTKSNPDLNVIKILLSLSRFKYNHYPPIIVEIKAFETKEKILALKETLKNLNKHHLIPINFDKRLGQIIAQTLIQKHMEDVYLSLFSFDGSEVYQVKNTTMEQILLNHPHAIPLEQKNNDVFVLSDDNFVKTIQNTSELTKYSLKLKPVKHKVKKNILVIGNNNKKSFIKETFEAYTTLYHSAFYTEFFEDFTSYQSFIKTYNEPYTLLLLSDDTVTDDLLDANIYDTLLKLETFKNHKPKQVIVELLDPKNDSLIREFNVENTIISNKIISLLLSKLALFKETESFYEDLLSIDPIEGKEATAIIIKTAEELIKDYEPMTFDTVKAFCFSIYQSSKKTLMPIGVIKADQVKVFSGDFTLQAVTLDDTTKIILMQC